jgi:23S rRNA (cytosine1962-C5)-methyltransferase
VKVSAVYLDPTRIKTLLNAHPWIFPKAIVRKEGPIKTGDLVSVFNLEKEFLGAGVYNEHSLYRVRMLAYAFEPVDKASIAIRLTNEF